MRALVLSLLILTGATVTAQTWNSRIHRSVDLEDTTQLQELLLLDYNKFLGTVMKIDGALIDFKLHSNERRIAIPTHQLRFLTALRAHSVEPVSTNKAVPLSDLGYERTALVNRERGQFRIINLLYFAGEFNLNDNFQLGGGVAGPLGILATAKYRTSLRPWLHLGLSNQSLYVPLADFLSGDGRTSVVGDATTILTIGTAEKFFNLGAGLLYNTADGEKSLNTFRAAVGGRIGERWNLYTEALAVVDDAGGLTFLPTLSASFARKRHRWGFGVFTVILDQDNFLPPPLPYLHYTHYFR